MSRSRGLITATLLTVGVIPKPATATDASAYASSEIQLYSVPNPYGTRELRRRRYTQTLGLTVADLLDRGAATGPAVTFSSRLRLDSDLGQPSALRDPARADEFVPGMSLAPVDVQYAFFDVRRLGGEALSVRLGRQYLVDPLGWWSFDGAQLRIDTPARIALSAFAGAEQRDGVPLLATSRFTADGVFRGSRRDLEVNQWPSYLDARRLAPAFGFGAASHELRWLDAEIVYRRVEERDAAFVTIFPETPGALGVMTSRRVATERLAGALRLSREELGELAGRLAYDFVVGRVHEHAASLSWFVGDPVTLSVGYDYSLPSFDGDSIFNWFSTSAVTTAEVAATLRARPHLSLSPRVGLRAYGAPSSGSGETGPAVTEADAPRSEAAASDAFGSLAVVRHWAAGSVTFDAGGDGGPDGHRVGTGAEVEQTFRDGFYDTIAGLSLHEWHDDQQPARDATSLSYVVGGGVHPAGGSRLGVEWEHTTNRLVGQRFRCLFTLRLEVGR